MPEKTFQQLQDHFSRSMARQCQHNQTRVGGGRVMQNITTTLIGGDEATRLLLGVVNYGRIWLSAQTHIANIFHFMAIAGKQFRGGTWQILVHQKLHEASA
jgi:hypothetical protein